MDPTGMFMAGSQPSAGAYSLGGLLFLGACVLVLIHCASSSRRKKSRQVEDSDDSGDIDVTGHDANGRGPRPGKARESQVKQQQRKNGGSGKVPSVTIVITPPSPRTDLRSDSANDGSCASPDDLDRKSTAANGSAQNDVTRHDVTPGHNVTTAAGQEGGSKVVVGSSTRSLSGIGDVNFVTSNEAAEVSERGEDSPPEPWVPKSGLSAMESAPPKSDYCVEVGDKSKVVKL